MNKMERYIVLPSKPKFYRRFVEAYRRRKKNELDELFSKINTYHPKMNLTIEINPSKFLDTKIAGNKNAFPNIKITSCLSIGNPLCQEITKTMS